METEYVIDEKRRNEKSIQAQIAFPDELTKEKKFSHKLKNDNQPSED